MSEKINVTFSIPIHRYLSEDKCNMIFHIFKLYFLYSDNRPTLVKILDFFSSFKSFSELIKLPLKIVVDVCQILMDC